MNTKLGLTRTVVRPNYALIARDSYVASALPGWSGCTSYVLLSGAIGAGLVQMLIDLKGDSHAQQNTGDEEWFLYVIAGEAAINGVALRAGGYAFLPPQAEFSVAGLVESSQLLVFRKIYEHLPEVPVPGFFTGYEQECLEAPFLGDPSARLKTLIPDSSAADMAVNIFTYDPGATLPFVETHVMEHGMLFLNGAGVYRLGEEWYPVTSGDAIWIAPYCPQWFIAAGPYPARYIYYKDVNRLPR